MPRHGACAPVFQAAESRPSAAPGLTAAAIATSPASAAAAAFLRKRDFPFRFHCLQPFQHRRTVVDPVHARQCLTQRQEICRGHMNSRSAPMRADDKPRSRNKSARRLKQAARSNVSGRGPPRLGAAIGVIHLAHGFGTGKNRPYRSRYDANAGRHQAQRAERAARHDR